MTFFIMTSEGFKNMLKIMQEWDSSSLTKISKSWGNIASLS